MGSHARPPPEGRDQNPQRRTPMIDAVAEAMGVGDHQQTCPDAGACIYLWALVNRARFELGNRRQAIATNRSKDFIDACRQAKGPIESAPFCLHYLAGCGGPLWIVDATGARLRVSLALLRNYFRLILVELEAFSTCQP